MKALIIYYTMSGRTKKVAEAIAGALTEYEISFKAFEIKGKYIEKIKTLDKFEHEDFSDIETELNELDAHDYDLVVIGMPTYGNVPPKAFDEIVTRIRNLDGKRIGIYGTARFTGDKSLETMKAKILGKGARIVGGKNFRRFFIIPKSEAIKFGTSLIEDI